MPLLPKPALIALAILCMTAGAGLLTAWVLMHTSNLFSPQALTLGIAAVILDALGAILLIIAVRSQPPAGM